MPKTHWDHFQAWCDAIGEAPDPPSWTTIVHYVRELVRAGERPETIEERIEALGDGYRERGLEVPTGHPRVLQELQAASRKATSALQTPGQTGESTPAKHQGAASVPAKLVDELASVPAEEVWLQGLKSERTRKAYRNDVRDFVRTVGVGSRDELYRVTPAAVQYWLGQLEAQGLKRSTIRRKLSSLSSLFKHLITKAPKYVTAEERMKLPVYNPVRDVERPSVERLQGATNVLSQEETRKVLDAPPLTKLSKDGKAVALTSEALVRSLRDRVILSIGFQTGARRSEIAYMNVGDLHHHDGYLCIRYVRKGGKEHRVPLHPETVARIEEYLAQAGHGEDKEGPLLRPTRRNQVERTDDMCRHLAPERIFQVFKRWVREALGAGREADFSPHSMRGTFITNAHKNGCPRERIQRDVGHAHASTTDLYIRAAEDLERAATFFANY